LHTEQQKTQTNQLDTGSHNYIFSITLVNITDDNLSIIKCYVNHFTACYPIEMGLITSLVLTLKGKAIPFKITYHRMHLF